MVVRIVEPKWGANAGRVAVDVRVENYEDRLRAERGEIASDEMMDWWIDLKTQRLVGNPEHGGEWAGELYCDSVSQSMFPSEYSS